MIRGAEGVDAVEVSGGATLRGSLRMPGDKSISHRALILAALADGLSSITGLATGADVAATQMILGALGAEFKFDDLTGTTAVVGSRLHAANGVLDVGNSGTGIRLLAGMCSGLDFDSLLDGDESIRRRPMSRILDPLTQMGATIASAEGFAPLAIRGGGLRGIDYTTPVASAQVKSAILLAGLFASTPTTVREPRRTRTHTEDMLAERGILIACHDEGERRTVVVQPGRPAPLDTNVPGDPSHAAFWICGAAGSAGCEVRVDNLLLVPERDGYLRILARMGAAIETTNGDNDQWSVQVRGTNLTGTRVLEHEVPDLIDEVPALAVAAMLADSPTRFESVSELRTKESDRVATTVAMVRGLGGHAFEDGNALVIEPGRSLGGVVDSGGDHRIAMAALIAACLGTRPATVTGTRSIQTSYPGFINHLQTLLG